MKTLSSMKCFTYVQVGIVGLPNVGKSTLFNTLTKMGIPAENFPFCTIEPNNVDPFPSFSYFLAVENSSSLLNRSTSGCCCLLLQARVNVPDDRFRWLCSTYKPKSEVPAFLEIVDIAGLVK